VTTLQKTSAAWTQIIFYVSVDLELVVCVIHSCITNVQM